MKIDKQILIDNSWYFDNKITVSGFGEFCYYKYDYGNFHLTIAFGYNNSGKIASIHIDNENFETIATADIDTVEQFNMLMNVIECDYQLLCHQ